MQREKGPSNRRERRGNGATAENPDLSRRRIPFPSYSFLFPLFFDADSHRQAAKLEAEKREGRGGPLPEYIRNVRYGEEGGGGIFFVVSLPNSALCVLPAEIEQRKLFCLLPYTLQDDFFVLFLFDARFLEACSTNRDGGDGNREVRGWREKCWRRPGDEMDPAKLSRSNMESERKYFQRKRFCRQKCVGL